MGNRWRQRGEQHRDTGDPGGDTTSDVIHSHTKLYQGVCHQFAQHAFLRDFLDFSGNYRIKIKCNLKLTEDGQGLDLAKTRLAEIMRAIPGKVIYDHFVQPPGPAPSSNIPESALPKVTARNLSQMLQDMDWSAARARMANDAAIKK